MEDYLNAVIEVYCRLLAMVQPKSSIEGVCGQCINSLTATFPEKPFLPVVAATILWYLPDICTGNVDYDRQTGEKVRETFTRMFRPLCEVGSEFLIGDAEVEAKVKIVEASRRVFKTCSNFYPDQINLTHLSTTPFLTSLINILKCPVQDDSNANLITSLSEYLDVVIDKSQVETEAPILVELVKSFDENSTTRFLYTPYLSLVQLVKSNGSTASTTALSSLSNLILTLVTKMVPIICTKVRQSEERKIEGRALLFL